MEFSNPFEHETMPDEPPKGTVLAYQITFGTLVAGERGAKTYDYVSFHAGDGKWYTTGNKIISGPESWQEFWANCTRRGTLGVMKYATAWTELSTGVAPDPSTIQKTTGDDWGKI